jgi:hypothetical protein
MQMGSCSKVVLGVAAVSWSPDAGLSAEFPLAFHRKHRDLLNGAQIKVFFHAISISKSMFHSPALSFFFFFRYKRGVIICNASHSQIYIPSLVSTKKVQLTGLGSLINNHSTGSPCEALEIPILFPFALFALPATQPTSAALEFSQVVPRPTRVSERSLDTITVALVFISDWLSITGQGTV